MDADEDIMIKKLKEHRNVIDVVVLIGEKEGVNINRTTGNDSNGDFSYSEADHNKVVQAIDKYIGEYKWEPKNTEK